MEKGTGARARVNQESDSRLEHLRDERGCVVSNIAVEHERLVDLHVAGFEGAIGGGTKRSLDVRPARRGGQRVSRGRWVTRKEGQRTC